MHPGRTGYGKSESSAPDSSSGDFAYLAAYFKDIGKRDDLFLAASRDGVTREELADESAPLVRPEVGSCEVSAIPACPRTNRRLSAPVECRADDFGFSLSRDLKTWAAPG